MTISLKNYAVKDYGHKKK